MPEPTRGSEALRAGTPLAIGSVTLLPIERVVLDSRGDGRRAWFSATKELYALIVRDARGIRAVDRNAAPIPLEALREKVPGLDAVLTPM